jgi:hypothetical protein
VRRAVWIAVIGFGLANLCLIGWAVVEGVRWAAGLVGCA